MANNLDISRHRELFDPDTFTRPITIIGAGATGSWLALALAKLGLEDITVWDFDKVEEHNIPNQAFRLKDIGISKVAALNGLLLRTIEQPIKMQNKRFTNEQLSGVVFMMIDTMEGRKKIWENSIKMKPSVDLLIEPRMGLDVGRVYNVIPTDMEQIRKYEETFYGDDVAEVSACGASKTVISSALGITSWCVRQLINFHNDEELANEILIDFKYNNLITTKW